MLMVSTLQALLVPVLQQVQSSVQIWVPLKLLVLSRPLYLLSSSLFHLRVVEKDEGLRLKQLLRELVVLLKIETSVLLLVRHPSMLPFDQTALLLLT